MADAREGPHPDAQKSGVRIGSIVDAVGWFILEQADEDDDRPGTWRREPIAVWALMLDGASSFVTGLSAAGRDVVELCPHPARYVHASAFPSCTCRFPTVLSADGFCATCAGTVNRQRALSA